MKIRPSLFLLLFLHTAPSNTMDEKKQKMLTPKQIKDITIPPEAMIGIEYYFKQEKNKIKLQELTAREKAFELKKKEIECAAYKNNKKRLQLEKTKIRTIANTIDSNNKHENLKRELTQEEDELQKRRKEFEKTRKEIEQKSKRLRLKKAKKRSRENNNRRIWRKSCPPQQMHYNSSFKES